MGLPKAQCWIISTSDPAVVGQQCCRMLLSSREPTLGLVAAVSVAGAHATLLMVCSQHWWHLWSPSCSQQVRLT
jgi:hypothetical protein